MLSILIWLWLSWLSSNADAFEPYVTVVRGVSDPRNPDSPDVRALLHSDVFQERLPLQDPFTNDAIIASCAVVGNAPTVLGSNLGYEIDRHEAVFRINFPYMRGFEVDVGRRTTHMFSNQRWGGFWGGRDGATSLRDFVNLTYVVELNVLSAFEQFMRDTAKPPVGLKPYVLSAYVGSTMYRFLNQISLRAGVVPSTGFYAAVAALLQCRSVSFYGFGDSGRFKKNHYWSGSSDSEIYDKHTYPLEEFILAAAERTAFLIPEEMRRAMRLQPNVQLRLESQFNYCYDEFIKPEFVDALKSPAVSALFHRTNCTKEETADLAAMHVMQHPDSPPKHKSTSSSSSGSSSSSSSSSISSRGGGREGGGG